MKTTILEISKPAMLAALAEFSAAAPKATDWEIQISVKALNVAALRTARLEGKSADEIAAVCEPKFSLSVYGWYGSDLKSGHDFTGLFFKKALTEVLKKLPTPETMAKFLEIERLKKEIADLEYAVRG